MMSEREILDGMLVLLERGWTRGVEARDRHGHSVDSESSRAVRWCVVGAARAAAPDYRAFTETMRVLRNAHGSEIIKWQDAKGRKKSEVLELVRRVRDGFPEVIAR